MRLKWGLSLPLLSTSKKNPAKFHFPNIVTMVCKDTLKLVLLGEWQYYRLFTGRILAMFLMALTSKEYNTCTSKVANGF